MSNRPRASRTSIKTPDAAVQPEKAKRSSTGSASAVNAANVSNAQNTPKSARSAKSEKQAQPAKPVKPEKTEKAAQAAKSAKSEKPAKQTKPTKTEKAAKQVKPAQQSQQTKPAKQARSSKSAEKPQRTTAVRKSAAEPRSPKKSGRSKKTAKPAEEPKTERVSNKTPQVLKLLEQDKSASNPVILAGKSRIPRMLSGREPLSKLMRREMGEVFSDIDDTVVVNLTQLAIEYEAPLILDRFNACSCDKCVEIFSCAIAKRVPARFARVTKGADLRTGGRASRELMERMDPVRKKVVTEMIKELIGNKKRCFHDDTEEAADAAGPGDINGTE